MTDTKSARPILRWVLGVGLFATVGLVVHYSVGWGPLLRPWTEIPAGKVGAALLLVLSSYAIRTIRIHRYFAPDTGGAFLRTFRLVLLHNLFNNLLPMRSGEASFPLLMKRDFGVPFLRSAPALVYLRLLDLHFLLLLGSTVFAVGRGPGAWILPAALLPLPLLGFGLQRRVQRGRVGTAEGPLAAVTWLESLPRDTAVFWWTWIWTAVNWTAKLMVYAWILAAFAPAPYAPALLGSITGELSSVLPFHGLAGAGTYEAGVLAGLLPLGLEMEVALSGAVNLHLFVLGASLLSGVLALLLPVGATGRS